MQVQRTMAADRIVAPNPRAVPGSLKLLLPPRKRRRSSLLLPLIVKTTTRRAREVIARVAKVAAEDVVVEVAVIIGAAVAVAELLAITSLLVRRRKVEEITLEVAAAETEATAVVATEALLPTRAVSPVVSSHAVPGVEVAAAAVDAEELQPMLTPTLLPSIGTTEWSHNLSPLPPSEGCLRRDSGS